MNITIKAKPVFYKATTKNELIRKIGSRFSYGLGSFGIGMTGLFDYNRDTVRVYNLHKINAKYDHIARFKSGPRKGQRKPSVKAKAESDAQLALADAAERQYSVDAGGKRELNEADNLLSAEQIAMKVKLELIKSLPEIIAQSVKPMENIEGIKILQVNGLTGQSGNAVEGESQSTNLADQMTNSALRYRAQAPLVRFSNE